MNRKYILHSFSIALCLASFNHETLAFNTFPEEPFSPKCVLLEYGIRNVEFGMQPGTEALIPHTPYLIPHTSYLIPLDTIPPIQDRQGDFIGDPNTNPFDLNDPSEVKQTVEYDPETGNYIITERIGDDYYRPPTYMTFDEYMDYQTKKQERDYFNEISGLGNTRSSTGRLDPLSKIDVKSSLIDRLFGGTEVDIRPQGNIDLTFGVEFSNTQNPAFTQRQQRQGGFDFDMQIQMNVQGSIGEKLKLATNYNTQATFDFDNTMKLDYNTDAFGEDDILKKIEAGNVSLPLRGTLIQGSQSLFGLKTEMQFGRLRLTAVASQQKSERDRITLKGGSQFQEFEVAADEYDENRHFFLTHYNRNNYEEALSQLPQIRTLFNIEKIQVWVTDTRNATENIRDIVAVADLGETTRTTNTTPGMQPPAIPFATDLEGEALPDNNANPIYGNILEDPRTRVVDRVVNTLRNPPFALQQGKDFEKVSARQLSPTEFTYHPQLGFISLNINVQPDQVVGVAFEYSYRDSVYQVGQIAEDVPSSTGATDTSITQNVLFVKMLKSTTQPVDLPTWDLMMKNIYSIGAYNVAREDFKLDIFYEDPGAGKKTFLPETNLKDIPLIQVFNLDRLNVQNDPQRDGVFDFVEGVTINTRNGRVIFPVLEPFGSGLAKEFTDPRDTAKYVFSKLYDETLFNAREYAEFNRFTIEGTYKSSVEREISLGAFNIPPGSVTVSAGGQHLVEGSDYEVDYTIGRVRILNDAILNAGIPVNVDFEDNTLFGFQTKTMIGLRADYEMSKHLTLGGTYLHLFERPFTQKVNIGDDPINNRIFGLDLNYSNEAPWLTKLVDKIPFISTKEASNITFSAETAALKPGHARAINEDSADDGDKGGVVYLDDFEGSVLTLDQRTPFNGTNGWMLSSAPQGQPDRFPEAQEKNTLAGVNRALLNWYRIDRTAGGAGGDNPYSALISQQEIFPNFTPTTLVGESFQQILDVVYDPTERGSYNFDLPNGTQFSAGLAPDATLEEPKTRWGGMMRSLNTNDFQSANIEFVEFWMLSPYLDTLGADAGNPDASSGRMNGKMYINFGNISEDILPDSRRFFENGLPGPNTQGRRAVQTPWGRVPIQQQLVADFDIDGDNRTAQDVGLDGLPDSAEQVKFATYLNAVQTSVAPAAFSRIQADPSNDNFLHYRSYPDDATITARHARYFGTERNSPLNNNNTFVESSTSRPDGEDLDGDRTMNETEGYFEYTIPIEYDGDKGVNLNNPFITESVQGDNGRVWYRFRIPLNLLDTDPNFKKVGGIKDFRSIRFMRMYFEGFEQKVSFRFATLDLVRNQWRRYRQALGSPCGPVVDAPEFIDETTFEVNDVNIEENSQKLPFNYTLPPGLSREQALGVNINALQNESALSMRVCGLEDGDSRAIFKNLGIDLRLYSKLKMFVHGEQTICGAGVETLEDGDLSMFIRIGSDFKNNYYEYELPLKISTDETLPFADPAYKRMVWPIENDFNIDFELLYRMKLERNASDVAIGDLYTANFMGADSAIMRIKGNPNLGLAKVVMIGVRNPAESSDCNGPEHGVEVWVNELRAFGLDERGGVAATARLDMQLADLGNLTFSTKASSIGFGSLDQQLAERSRERIIQYDMAANVALDKFLPEKTGVKVPFYFQYSKEARSPQYDPYDLDIELKDKIAAEDDPLRRDTIRDQAQHVTTIKSYNFTNVRKERTNSEKKPMPWDIANFSFTYAFDETERRDPIIESDKLTRRRGALDYTYSRQTKYIEPFKKLIKKDKYLKFIKDMNFNPLPNSFSFSTDLDRRFNTTKYRFTANDPLYSTYYNKQFLWNRTYDLQWDLTKNIKFNFNADNRGLIDEPDETLMYKRNRLDTNDPEYIGDIDGYRRDSIRSNLKDLGRTKNYQHTFGVNYNVPLKNFPFLDWVNVKASYQANYGWDASSQAANTISLGNVIRNGQTRQVGGDFDFEKLYNYVPYLKTINSKQRPGGKDGKSRKGKQDAEEEEGDGAPGAGRDGRGGAGKDNPDRNRDGKNDTMNPSDSKDNPDAGGKAGKKGKAGKSGGRGDVDAPGGADADGSLQDDKKAKKGKKKNEGPSGLERGLIRPLMSVRKLRLNYQEQLATVVPGYMPDSKILGMNQFDSPGWGFVAGGQPNISPESYYSSDDWLYNNWDWISGDQLLNQPVTQNYQQTMDAKLTLEPFPDFRIDVEATRSKTKNHSEFFRRNEIFQTPDDRFQEEWEHLIPRDFGQFTTSYSAMKTLFNDDLTGLFHQFEDNRVIVANRIGSGGAHSNDEDAALGFPKGFGRYQQNVLVPSFLAAYTEQDPNTMKVSPDYIDDVLIKTRPRPNWRLTYNGLSKVGFFQDIFQSFTLSHGYKGTLTVSSFESNLQFNQLDQTREDQVKFDYFSRFEVPNIQIQEQFSPLLGVDMRLKNEMSFKVEYKSNRTLNMGFVDNRLHETKGKDMTIGFGYKIKELKLGFLSPKKSKAKKKKEEDAKKADPKGGGAGKGANAAGDFDVTFDFSIKDDITNIHELDTDVVEPSRGNRTVSILPQATYQVNKQLSLRLFFDYRRNVPKTSQGFPTTNIRSGVTVRFTLDK